MTLKSDLANGVTALKQIRALADSMDATVKGVEVLRDSVLSDAENVKALVGAMETLIGETDKPKESAIADPVPGGNGGTFKSKETLAKGHGISGAIETSKDPNTRDARKQALKAHIEQAGGQIEWREAWAGFGMDAANWLVNEGTAKRQYDEGTDFDWLVLDIPEDKKGFAPSDLTGGESDYAPDPEDDK